MVAYNRTILLLLHLQHFLDNAFITFPDLITYIPNSCCHRIWQVSSGAQVFPEVNHKSNSESRQLINGKYLE